MLQYPKMNLLYFQIFLLLASWLVIESNAVLSESQLRSYLQNVFEKETTDLCYRTNVAEFAYLTDVKNKSKEEISVRKF